jgi:hypothetical protein
MIAQFDPMTCGVRITMSNGFTFHLSEGEPGTGHGGLIVTSDIKTVAVLPRASNSVEIVRAP